jgi:DHA3 family macrolide efflux protein-like MFS transporter
LQDVVAPEIQGRVFTVISSVSGMAAPLGMAIAGPVADAFGVQLWFLVGGIASVLMGVSLRMIPAIMHLEDGGPRVSGVVNLEEAGALLVEGGVSD